MHCNVIISAVIVIISVIIVIVTVIMEMNEANQKSFWMLTEERKGSPGTIKQCLGMMIVMSLTIMMVMLRRVMKMDTEVHTCKPLVALRHRKVKPS